MNNDCYRSSLGAGQRTTISLSASSSSFRALRSTANSASAIAFLWNNNSKIRMGSLFFMVTQGNCRTARLKVQSNSQATGLLVRSVAGDREGNSKLASAFSALREKASRSGIVRRKSRFACFALPFPSMLMIRQSRILGVFNVWGLFRRGLTTMDSTGEVPICINKFIRG